MCQPACGARTHAFIAHFIVKQWHVYLLFSCRLRRGTSTCCSGAVVAAKTGSVLVINCCSSFEVQLCVVSLTETQALTSNASLCHVIPAPCIPHTSVCSLLIVRQAVGVFFGLVEPQVLEEVWQEHDCEGELLIMN